MRKAIAEYYRERYHRDSEMIPYGAEVGPVETYRPCSISWVWSTQKYFLYVSRMEPENNGLLVREAFEQSRRGLKLALIGDAPYAAEYIAKVRDTSDPRIVIPGAIYGEGYQRTGLALLRLHSRDRGRRHASGADRSHGARRADVVSRHAGKRRGRGRRGDCRLRTRISRK